MRTYLMLSLLSLVASCASAPPTETCNADTFASFVDPPYSCRGGRDAADFLAATIRPEVDRLVRRSMFIGAFRVRAGFSQDGTLKKYCVDTTGEASRVAQKAASKIREAIDAYGAIPSCLSGSRMLLFQAKKEKSVWHKNWSRSTSMGAPLHRGLRDFQERTYDECMKEPDPNALICEFKSRGPMITSNAPVTGEVHYFAPALLHPVTKEERDCMPFRVGKKGSALLVECLDIGKEERQRVILLCGGEKDASRKIGCFKREGWVLLDPDPAIF